MMLVIVVSLNEEGDRVMVPWYQRSGTCYNIVQMWWKLPARNSYWGRSQEVAFFYSS